MASIEDKSYKDRVKKPAPCRSCKKKPPVTELPEIIDENVWVPSRQEIKEAYAELSNMKGVTFSKREMINKVYSFIFQEDFDFDCGGCATNQGRKFYNYMVNILKEDV